MTADKYAEWLDNAERDLSKIVCEREDDCGDYVTGAQADVVGSEKIELQEKYAEQDGC